MRIVPFFIILFSSYSWATNTICYIGDSQSASAGETESLFQNIQPTLEHYGTFESGMAVCGAGIGSYLGYDMTGCHYAGVTHLNITKDSAKVVSGSGRTTNISNLMPPADTVIIQLGDNNLGETASASGLAKELVTKILSAGKKCIWISPASIGGARCASHRKEKGEMSAALEAAIKSTEINGQHCAFINSFELTDSNPPMSQDPECLHYSGIYPQWSNAILPSLTKALQGLD